MAAVVQQLLFSYGAFVVDYHFPADRQDINLYTFLQSRGWNTLLPVVANIYVGSAVLTVSKA